MVLLHGEGNDTNGIIDYTDIASKADAEHFIVVSPNALLYDEHLLMQDCFTYCPDVSFTDSTALWGLSALPLDGLVTIENNVFVGSSKGVAIDGWGK